LTEPARSPPSKPPRKPWRWHGWASHLVLDAVVLVLIAVLVVLFSVDTPFGQAFIVARLNGTPVGPFGRLHVEGLGGEVWSDFTLTRLTIADRDGVWLDVKHVELRWRPIELLTRRVHITAAVAGQVQLIREPLLQPSGPSGPQPLALTIDRFGLELETLPAASSTRGLFGATGGIDLERNGALAGNVQMLSRLHPGDGLSSRFDFGVHQRLAVTAQAREAQGGAIAGLLGLAANRPFSLDALAGGARGDGWLRVRAASGDQQVATADGSWTKAGGQAIGRLSLAASRQIGRAHV
jgi:translocation and assembly module TamB